MPSIFSRLWYQVREIPDVKVNLVRAGELGSYARQVIPGWILPLGMIGGWLVFPTTIIRPPRAQATRKPTTRTSSSTATTRTAWCTASEVPA